MLISNKSVKRLYLFCTNASCLFKSLQRNTTLQELVVARTNIDDTKDLAVYVQNTNSLVKLCLWDNRLGNRGTATIAQGLKGNTSITELRIMSNEVQDSGACAIANALLHNTTVKEIDLSGKRIGTFGGRSLIKALKTSPSSVELCDSKEVDKSTMKEIRYLSSLNKALNKVDRRVLQEFPKCMWPTVLAKVKEEPNLTYILLRERPDFL